METPGHIGDGQVAASSAEEARRRWREERWRRVRSLRLKSWCFSALWPLIAFIFFVAYEVGLYFLVQLVPGLGPHDAAVYGLAAQIAGCIVFVAAGAYVIFSPRNEAWIRRWARRGLWGVSAQPMPKAKYHARYCAARNRGTAAIFLGFSTLELFYAWRDLSKPLTTGRTPILLIAGLLLCIALLGILFRSLTCFRERLALSIGILSFFHRLVVGVAPSFATQYGSAVRNLSLILWASAVLVSLDLLKSALRAPAPGTSHLS